MSSSRVSRRALAALPAILLPAAATSVANAQSFYSVPLLRRENIVIMDFNGHGIPDIAFKTLRVCQMR